MIRAIIGLGNPGPKFYHHRHSIGFRILDAIAEQYNAQWTEKPLMLCATVTLNKQSVLLIKPQTFMNDSGRILPDLLRQGLKAENILVVHDELEKAFGEVQIRTGGSHRGHNGLRSIMAICGPNFTRLRCGIGRPDRKEDVPHYVLSNFSEDPVRVNEFITKAVNCIEQFLATQQQEFCAR